MAKNSIVSGGIDTSKGKLDAAVHGEKKTVTVTNDPAGWKALATWFAQATARSPMRVRDA